MRESWEDMHYGDEDFEALDSSQGSEYLVYTRDRPPRNDTNKWLKWRKDSMNPNLRQRSFHIELWIISLRFAEKLETLLLYAATFVRIPVLNSKTSTRSSIRSLRALPATSS